MVAGLVGTRGDDAESQQKLTGARKGREGLQLCELGGLLFQIASAGSGVGRPSKARTTREPVIVLSDGSVR